MHVFVWTATVLRHMLPTSVICTFSNGLQQYSVTCCLPLWYACSRMDFNSTPSHVAYLCDMHVLVWTGTVLRHMLPTSVICMFSYGLRPYSVTCCSCRGRRMRYRYARSGTNAASTLGAPGVVSCKVKVINILSWQVKVIFYIGKVKVRLTNLLNNLCYGHK